MAGARSIIEECSELLNGKRTHLTISQFVLKRSILLSGAKDARN